MAGSLRRKTSGSFTRSGVNLLINQGIDGNKIAAMMGGSVQRKAFGFGLNRRQDLGNEVLTERKSPL
jgi:hypothetical protein